MEWRLVGPVALLKMKPCRRLYTGNKSDDLALIYATRKATFYAVQAWCPHAGGPLYNGDIEDMADKTLVSCPWHGYEFDVKAGTSAFGLPIDTFEVKVENDNVYVKYKCALSFEDEST